MMKRIDIADLRVGMYVQEFCCAWRDTPFWRSSLMVESARTLEQIQASNVRQVWIDTERGKDVSIATMVRETVDTVPGGLSQEIAPKRVAFDAEIDHAKRICTNGMAAVSMMFQEARMGNAINTGKAVALVEEISSSVMRNPDALISLARLKNKDDYTYMHSVAVCALMIALGRKMKFNEQDLRDVGMAGLLHDIGKMMVPQDILNKPGKLSDDEFSAVREHPVHGHKLLLDGSDISEMALDVCLHHHERVDGKGYPHQLRGEQISLFARMGAVCDVYDAITSNRAYKPGWEPSESLRRMAEWSGTHFDTDVFQAFVKCIGIYPTGTLVRLKSGRLGVVVEQGESSLLAPKVKVFFSAKSNAYIPPEIIDLSRLEGQDKITGIEDAEKLGLKNTNSIWTDH